MTGPEMRSAFEGLDGLEVEQRLMVLRSIRESLLANPGDLEFEEAVYAYSVKECIDQHRFELVRPLLAHMSPKSTRWARLNCISLGCAREFIAAEESALKINYWEFLACISALDLPVYKYLLSVETDELARGLMTEAKSLFDLDLRVYRGTKK